MRQVLTDLWETRTDSPFPGLTTHAYLWTPRNALFYSVATDADFDAIGPTRRHRPPIPVAP